MDSKQHRLSDEAHFALNRYLAIVGAGHHRKAFLHTCKLARINPDDKRLFKKGLEELIEKGIAKAKRDGLGEWEILSMDFTKVRAGPFVTESWM